jgi:hypothetical protein
MESLGIQIYKKRMDGTMKIMRPGQCFMGEHCKVFYFKSPNFFADIYMVGITIHEGNLTYTAEMEDHKLNIFFRDVFKDEKDFLKTLESNQNFSYTGDDI